MGSFSFRCPQCNQSLEAQDEWRGRETQCPACSSTITVPVAIRLNTEKPLAPDDRKCPLCGETIKKEAVFCRWCKQNIPSQNSNNFNSYPNMSSNTYGQNSEISLTERLCGRQAAQTGKFDNKMLLIFALAIILMPIVGLLFLIFGIILMCKGESKNSITLGAMYIGFWVASLFAWGWWIAFFNMF